MLSRYFLAFASLALVAPSFASQPVWLRCQGCVGQQAADLAASWLWPGTRLVIYDRHAGWAQGFQIVQQSIGDDCHERSEPSQKPQGRWQGCQLAHAAVANELAADEQALLAAIVSVHQETQGQMKTRIEIASSELLLPAGPVTGDPDGSAIDAGNGMWAYQLTRQADQHYARILTQGIPGNPPLPGMPTGWRDLTRAMTDWIFGNEVLTVTMVVVFPDGSKVELTRDGDRPDFRVVRAVDAFDRPIPNGLDTPPLGHYVGDTYFPSNRAAENWAQGAIMAGAVMDAMTNANLGHVHCTFRLTPEGVAQLRCRRS